ncbi:MAG TPA: hypothetical protein PKY77_23775 [Phycisphaerae bacterium]|nr:hypothetical protein [Phycisphaerae bacterium]HRY71350.1 hypothetical protein [Phycisphaerae bacterium]HSA29804.1 hypothetical protein [Phycisphaerae bacterium]
MAKIHWVWRAVIAVAAGWGYAFLSLTVLRVVHDKIKIAITDVLTGGNVRGPFWLESIGISVSYFLPAILLTVIAYGVLMRPFEPTPDARETRCRKCGYILRGISEPRCPECGERI